MSPINETDFYQKHPYRKLIFIPEQDKRPMHTKKKSTAVYLSTPNSTHLWQDPARTKAKDVADTETVRRCQVGV